MSKTAVITGVTRGLGRSMLDRFIESGWRVAGCGRSKDQIAALKSRYSSPNHFTSVDVSDDRQVAQWAGGILAELGPPDLLVNNAAVINPNTRLWETKAAEFDPVIDVNIKGVANVIRHFVPAMVKQKAGVIVNFSSTWGRTTSPEVAPYCTTKWAIEGLTQSLAQELPRGMAAVAFNPGIIDTGMLRQCFGDSAGHYWSPAEWSKVAVPFLIGLGARNNGQSVSVPGYEE